MEGNLSAAIKLWEEALEIDPNNPKARENIEKARRERGY
jgi:tetratricopeptide (TPR) repeat protein